MKFSNIGGFETQQPVQKPKQVSKAGASQKKKKLILLAAVLVLVVLLGIVVCYAFLERQRLNESIEELEEETEELEERLSAETVEGGEEAVEVQPNATEGSIQETAEFIDEDYVLSGNCGENVQWSFMKDTGELTIVGTGKMNDYPKDNSGKLTAPWDNLEIRSLKIEGVSEIGDEAFISNDSLVEIYISASVTKIGKCAFAMCPGLQQIGVSEDNPNYMSIDGVLFTKDGKTLVQYPVGKKQPHYEIPDGVEVIGEMAFANTGENLSAITIPASATKIEYGAFLFCRALENVYYGGTETQWKNVTIDRDNDLLQFAQYDFSDAED